jgi:hypothetical protein
MTNNLSLEDTYMATITTQEMITMFNKVNADCMRDGADSVPFSDVDYYAEQIAVIYEVSEIRAYELATQLAKEIKKMSEFTMEGFNHISADGIAEFWQLLHQQGTIDLLWDMQPKTKINALMQSENFDMDAHIKTNYCDHDSVVYNYDEIVTDMLDELLETIITLEYCFIYDVYNIDFKGRSLKNLDAIPDPGVWSPNVYLPITAPEQVEFTDIFTEFSQFCMEKTAEGYEVQTVVITGEPVDEDGNGYVMQQFEWLITGAADFNALQDMIDCLTEHHCFPNLKVIAQLKK